MDSDISSECGISPVESETWDKDVPKLIGNFFIRNIYFILKYFKKAQKSASDNWEIVSSIHKIFLADIQILNAFYFIGFQV